MLPVLPHETAHTTNQQSVSRFWAKCITAIAMISALVGVAHFTRGEPLGRTKISNALQNAKISRDRTADQCLPGEYYDEVTRRDCVPCLVGHYCPGGDMLLECPAGTFQNRPGQIACVNCPANQISEDMGAETCTACPPGTCAPPGSSACSPCSTQPPGTCGVSFEFLNSFGVLPGRTDLLCAAGSTLVGEAMRILSNNRPIVDRQLPAGNVNAVVTTTFNAQPDATCSLNGVTGPGLPGSSSVAGYWVLYSAATVSHRNNCFHFYQKGNGFVVIPQSMSPRWMDYGLGTVFQTGSRTGGVLYVNRARRGFSLARVGDQDRMVFPPHRWYFRRVSSCNIGGQVNVVPRRFF